MKLPARETGRPTGSRSSRSRLGHICGTVVAVTSSLVLASCELETREQRLARAARGMDVVAVERLLAEGADPNSKDANGVTPLLIAAERGDVPSVEAVIKRGAAVNSVDVDGRTPLMLSAWSFRAVVVVALLRHGADPCLKSGDGRTALAGSLLGSNQPDAFAAQRRQVIEGLQVVNCDGKLPAALTSGVASFSDCSGCPEMVVIPGGSFTMGSSAKEPGQDEWTSRLLSELEYPSTELRLTASP